MGLLTLLSEFSLLKLRFDFLVDQESELKKSLEDLTYSLNQTGALGVSIHSSSLDGINTKMEDLGYLHGIAKQIDGLKEKAKRYRIPEEF